MGRTRIGRDAARAAGWQVATARLEVYQRPRKPVCGRVSWATPPICPFLEGLAARG